MTEKVLDQRQAMLVLAFRGAVERQKNVVQHHKYMAAQEQSVLDAMQRSLDDFMKGYRL